MDPKDKIAMRAEKEIEAGQVINLGIGIPTLIMKYLSPDKPVMIHSENGIIGMGSHCGWDRADRNEAGHPCRDEGHPDEGHPDEGRLVQDEPAPPR